MVRIVRAQHPEKKELEAILVLPQTGSEAYYFSQVRNGDNTEFSHRNWQSCTYTRPSGELFQGPARAFLYRGAGGLEAAADKIAVKLRTAMEESPREGLPRELVDSLARTTIEFPDLKNISEEYCPVWDWSEGFDWAVLEFPR